MTNLNAISEKYLAARLRFLACVMVAGAGALQAQEVALHASSRALPDAPSFMLISPQQAAVPVKDPATVSGIVSDIRGGLVPGASVRLKEKNVAGTARDITSDSEGRFSFAGVAPGTYFVIISSPGLEGFRSADFVLRPGERYELPDIALPIASNTTTVDVVMTQSQIADEELKLETQQRVFGVIPNFYTSFVWDAAPMNTKQKFKLSLRSVTDPFEFVSVAIVAGIEQAHNTFPEYGDDADAYGKRYGAAYGDAVIGRTLGSAVFPSIFRQDPRYFYMGPAHSFGKRLVHALSAGIVARGDNGRTQPNYSHILGNASAGAISTLYHPDGNSAGDLALRNGLIGIAGRAFQGVIREFVSWHVTTKVPSYANGKPAAVPAAAKPAASPASPATP